MKTFNRYENPFLLSIILAVLVISVSCFGIFTPGFYGKESFNWQIQSRGQDIIDLFIITPVLLLAALFRYKKNQVAIWIWAGTLSYLAYTFTIYCFAVHFNKLFILYCFILGLSIYSLVWLAYANTQEKPKIEIKSYRVSKSTGIYFLVISIAFYFLWFAEIIPATAANTTPESLIEIGLFTNPVHVLDIALFLPFIFITGIMLLKRKKAGLLLSLSLLTFFILMDITIGWLAFEMKQKGLGSNLSVTIGMIILSLISLLFLILNIKNIKIKSL